VTGIILIQRLLEKIALLERIRHGGRLILIWRSVLRGHPDRAEFFKCIPARCGSLPG